MTFLLRWLNYQVEIEKTLPEKKASRKIFEQGDLSVDSQIYRVLAETMSFQSEAQQ
jgi:hypothetical protein